MAAAFYKDPEGKELPAKVAAVELINFIRPTVAISYYITFAALALYKHPEYLERLKKGNAEFIEQFVNEIRRYYPFGPFLGANVKEDFEWKGYSFEKGTLVLLDVYGTNHDKRHWEKPEEFWPENFSKWGKSPFDFIPQGGGDYYNGHRCPGEWITIEVMKRVLNLLAEFMTYEVPEQDLNYSLKRMPTYPKSGFVMTKVKGTGVPSSPNELLMAFIK